MQRDRDITVPPAAASAERPRSRRNRRSEALGGGAGGVTGGTGAGNPLGAPPAATAAPGQADTATLGTKPAVVEQPAMRRLGGSELYMGDPQRLKKRDGSVAFIVVCLVLIPLIVVAATLLPSGIVVEGSNVSHDFAWWREALVSNAGAFADYLSGVGRVNGIQFTFWRYCTIAMAGAGLAASGAVCQGTLKNYMASPTTLGVVSGGTLGAVVFVLLFQMEDDGLFITASEYASQLAAMQPGEYIMEVFGRQLFSLAGCVLVTACVLGVAYVAGHGKFSKVALVVIGQVFVSVIAAVTGLIRYYITYAGTADQLEKVTNLTNGVFADSISVEYFAAMAVPVAVCLAVLLLCRRRLNLLSFSDDEARSMGLSVGRSRVVAMLLCTVITACVVSFCGAIGFVGFMIPHFVRRIVGPDFKYLLPASMVVGALFLVLAYQFMTVSNILNGSLGLFSTALGTVVFVASLIVARRRGNVAWN